MVNQEALNGDYLQRCGSNVGKLRFMVMLELLSLLSLKRQVEGEMTLVRRKSCTESKLEAKFDLSELNVFI